MLCSSSTKKESIIEFAENNKQKTIKLHYEYNYGEWGNDDVLIFNASNESEFQILLEYINNNYIHEIDTL